jgi:hypothetical protein
MSEPGNHDHSDHAHGSGDSHDAHGGHGGGHDDHAAAGDIIPENSFQDKLLVFVAALCGLGLVFMMWIWSGVAIPPVSAEHGHEEQMEAPEPGHAHQPATQAESAPSSSETPATESQSTETKTPEAPPVPAPVNEANPAPSHE